MQCCDVKEEKRMALWKYLMSLNYTFPFQHPR